MKASNAQNTVSILRHTVRGRKLVVGSRAMIKYLVPYYSKVDKKKPVPIPDANVWRQDHLEIPVMHLPAGLNPKFNEDRAYVHRYGFDK